MKVYWVVAIVGATSVLTLTRYMGVSNSLLKVPVYFSDSLSYRRVILTRIADQAKSGLRLSSHHSGRMNKNSLTHGPLQDSQ